MCDLKYCIIHNEAGLDDTIPSNGDWQLPIMLENSYNSCVQKSIPLELWKEGADE